MTLMPPPSLGATYQYIPHRPPRSRAELYCCGGELQIGQWGWLEMVYTLY